MKKLIVVLSLLSTLTSPALAHDGYNHGGGAVVAGTVLGLGLGAMIGSEMYNSYTPPQPVYAAPYPVYSAPYPVYAAPIQPMPCRYVPMTFVDSYGYYHQYTATQCMNPNGYWYNTSR